MAALLTENCFVDGSGEASGDGSGEAALARRDLYLYLTRDLYLGDLSTGDLSRSPLRAEIRRNAGCATVQACRCLADFVASLLPGKGPSTCEETAVSSR